MFSSFLYGYFVAKTISNQGKVMKTEASNLVTWAKLCGSVHRESNLEMIAFRNSHCSSTLFFLCSHCFSWIRNGLNLARNFIQDVTLWKFLKDNRTRSRYVNNIPFSTFIYYLYFLGDPSLLWEQNKDRKWYYPYLRSLYSELLLFLLIKTG
jgi:hypothetical protein